MWCRRWQVLGMGPSYGVVPPVLIISATSSHIEHYEGLAIVNHVRIFWVIVGCKRIFHRWFSDQDLRNIINIATSGVPWRWFCSSNIIRAYLPPVSPDCKTVKVDIVIDFRHPQAPDLGWIPSSLLANSIRVYNWLEKWSNLQVTLSPFQKIDSYRAVLEVWERLFKQDLVVGRPEDDQDQRQATKGTREGILQRVTEKCSRTIVIVTLPG